MQYRKEIDGLRAIAVVSVILSHIGIQAFEGGFVGVDVFFVISGFLITSLILSDMAHGKFSFLDFYYRRSKRILPALFLTVMLTLLAGWYILLPVNYADLIRTALNLSVFSSNIYLSKVSGYFDTNSIHNPLLHTWSLSIEEQYYLIFPVLLIVIFKLFENKKYVLKIVGYTLLAILSFSLFYAENKVRSKPDSAFFLLQTRMWELMIGSLAAYLVLFKHELISGVHPIIRRGLSYGAFAALCYAILTFNESTPTPGFLTLFPTLSTACLILFIHQESYLYQVLTYRPVIFVGLISYSLYLVHQPLVAFSRYANVQFDALNIVLLLMVIFALGYLSWRFVEQPFRKISAQKKQTVLVSSVLIIVFLFSALLLASKQLGFPDRFPPSINQISAKSTDLSMYPHCAMSGKTADNALCIIGNKDKVTTALLGDSHAYALASGFKQYAVDQNTGVYLSSGATCPPVLDVFRADMLKSTICEQKVKQSIDYVLSNPDIKNIVIVGRWSLYLDKQLFDNQEGGKEYGRRAYLDVIDNGHKVLHEEQKRKELLMEKYVETINFLIQSGKKVILVYPIPEVGWMTPLQMSRNMLYSNQAINPDYLVTTRYDVYLNRHQKVINAFDQIAFSENFVRVKPDQVFCNTAVKDRCIASIKHVALYHDDDHLSEEGSNMLFERIRPELH